MSHRRTVSKYVAFAEMERDRIDGRRLSLATVIVEALETAGFRLLREDPLDDVKWLMAEVLRLNGRYCSPVLIEPPPAKQGLPSSDGVPSASSHEWPCDIEESDVESSNQTGCRPMEVFMAEDSLVFARITMAALRKGCIEHRLTWLTDGQEALDFLHRRGRYGLAPRPDLILLDLGLPTVDGRTVLADIKSDHALRSIPVVVMTASTSDQDRIASEQLDIAAYLTKPVDLRKFLELVRELKSYWQADMILPD